MVRFFKEHFLNVSVCQVHRSALLASGGQLRTQHISLVDHRGNKPLCYDKPYLTEKHIQFAWGIQLFTYVQYCHGWGSLIARRYRALLLGLLKVKTQLSTTLVSSLLKYLRHKYVCVLVLFIICLGIPNVFLVQVIQQNYRPHFKTSSDPFFIQW